MYQPPKEPPDKPNRNPLAKENLERGREFNPARRTLDLFAIASAVIFIAAGVRMLTITAESESIVSDFIHAVGIFSIAMAAIPILLRKR